MKRNNGQRRLTPVEREVLRSLMTLPQRAQRESELRAELHRSIVHLQRELDSLSASTGEQ